MLAIGCVYFGGRKKLLCPSSNSFRYPFVRRAIDSCKKPSVVNLHPSIIRCLILIRFSLSASEMGTRASSPILFVLRSILMMVLLELRYRVNMVVAPFPSRLLFDRLSEMSEQSFVKAGSSAFNPWLPILLSEMLRILMILFSSSRLHKSVQAWMPRRFLWRRS